MRKPEMATNSRLHSEQDRNEERVTRQSTKRLRAKLHKTHFLKVAPEPGWLSYQLGSFSSHLSASWCLLVPCKTTGGSINLQTYRLVQSDGYHRSLSTSRLPWVSSLVLFSTVTVLDGSRCVAALGS